MLQGVMSKNECKSEALKVKTGRKPYSKGFKQAVQSLQDLATSVHGGEIDGLNKHVVATAKSTGILAEVVRLQELVIGEDESRPTLSKLAEFHCDLSEYSEAAVVLKALLAKPRRPDIPSQIECVDVIRRLANCHEALGQFDEADKARAEASQVIETLVGLPALISVFRRLVRDEFASERLAEANCVPDNSGPYAASVPPISPKRGEVWWVRLPNHPNDPHQPRPAVVLSRNDRNEACTEVVVVPLSSSDSNSAYEVTLAHGLAGLDRKSFTRRWHVTSLHKSLIVNGPIGVVPDYVLNRITEKVQAVVLP